MPTNINRMCWVGYCDWKFVVFVWNNYILIYWILWNSPEGVPVCSRSKGIIPMNGNNYIITYQLDFKWHCSLRILISVFLTTTLQNVRKLISFPTLGSPVHHKQFDLMSLDSDKWLLHTRRLIDRDSVVKECLSLSFSSVINYINLLKLNTQSGGDIIIRSNHPPHLLLLPHQRLW